MDRSKQHLRWVITLCFFTINCGPVQRDSRTRVMVDGHHAVALQEQRGCDTGLEHEWEHAHTSASVAVEHENSNGFVAEGRLRVALGRIVGYRHVNLSVDPAPMDDGYTMTALGGVVGYDGALAGVAAGVSVVHASGREPIPEPFARVKLGVLDTAWGELAVGDADPVFALRLITLGVGFRAEAFTGRVGITGYTQLVPNLPSAESSGLRFAEERAGLSIDLAWRPDDGIGFTGGAIVGDYPAGRIGVVWSFGED